MLLFQVPLAVACAAGMVIFCMSKSDVLPKWHMALVLLAFLSCIAWLDLIGNECVAVLEALGTIMGVTKTERGHSIMGITVRRKVIILFSTVCSEIFTLKNGKLLH